MARKRRALKAKTSVCAKAQSREEPGVDTVVQCGWYVGCMLCVWGGAVGGDGHNSGCRHIVRGEMATP